jgi:uncharacterized membrane-anchored protein YhcB (DUF1043 family)
MEKKKTNTFILIFTIFFALVSIVAGVFLFITYQQLNSTKHELNSVYQELKTAKSSLVELQTKLDESTNKIGDLETSSNSLQSKYAKSQTDLTLANSKLGAVICEDVNLKMTYDDSSKIAIKLQNYVSDLQGVETVSYVIPERIYSNTDSRLYYVQYVNSSDHKVYAKRYMVYVSEFGWKKATFSIDDQCWIDYP